MRTHPLAVVAGLTAVLLAGCSALPQSPPPLPSPGDVAAPVTTGPKGAAVPAQTAETVEDGFSNEEHTAMRIRARTCDAFSVGTGFMLDEHTVVTNRHVVEGAQTITLTTYDGAQYEGTGSVIADFADLALITVDGPLEFAVTLGTDGPEEGDLLDVVGYPLGGPLETRSGPYVRLVPDSLGTNRANVDMIEVTAEHGNSGSGVYDSDGDIVGVLYATDEGGDSFAVTLEALDSFIADTSQQLPNNADCN